VGSDKAAVLLSWFTFLRRVSFASVFAGRLLWGRDIPLCTLLERQTLYPLFLTITTNHNIFLKLSWVALEVHMIVKKLDHYASFVSEGGGWSPFALCYGTTNCSSSQKSLSLWWKTSGILTNGWLRTVTSRNRAE